MVILNLKNYFETTGANLPKVIEAVEKVFDQEPALIDKLAISPAPYDLHLAKTIAKRLQVVSPHVDAKKAGSTTGWVPAESLKALGVEMSILNHSEHRFSDWQLLEQHITEVQAAEVNLIVCCENLDEAQKLIELKPYGIAFEDKDLIGSGNSITTGRPDDVKRFIDMVNGQSKAIVGAGVSTAEDVQAGLGFGAEGFLLASAFAKAEDKFAKALELASPYLK